MIYDPSLVTYEELLDTFWSHIDPTQKDGQGNDRGTQYRTGIYTHSEEQRLAAEESKEKLQRNLAEVKGVQVSFRQGYSHHKLAPPCSYCMHLT